MHSVKKSERIQCPLFELFITSRHPSCLHNALISGIIIIIPNVMHPYRRRCGRGEQKYAVAYKPINTISAAQS
jgi:hypothetical protein